MMFKVGVSWKSPPRTFVSAKDHVLGTIQIAFASADIIHTIAKVLNYHNLKVLNKSQVHFIDHLFQRQERYHFSYFQEKIYLDISCYMKKCGTLHMEEMVHGSQSVSNKQCIRIPEFGIRRKRYTHLTPF